MIRLAMAALMAGLMHTGAGALDLTEERFDARIGGRAVPVTARLAEEGLGYSVLQGVPDRRGRYLVHVTCREGRHARAACPTPVYAAICPTARIACR
jgi:hypothetical protein